MTDSGFVTSYDKNLADEVKAELKKSIALNPDYAENYSLFAFVSAVRNEDVDEALGYIQKALSISPGNEIISSARPSFSPPGEVRRRALDRAEGL